MIGQFCAMYCQIGVSGRDRVTAADTFCPVKSVHFILLSEQNNGKMIQLLHAVSHSC